MSTWRIAVDAAGLDEITKRRNVGVESRDAGGAPAGAGANERIENDVLGRVTKWIPGDTLALYAMAVTAFAGSPSIVLLALGAAFAGLSVVGIAFARGVSIDGRRVTASAILAVIAFAIWSAAIPQSGWQWFDAVARHPAITAVGATAAGSLFCLFAEGVMSRITT